MFDSFANAGLKRPKKTFQNFYTALDQNDDFDSSFDKIAELIENTEFVDLYPARIIDKFLMLRGSNENQFQKKVLELEGLLRFLPDHWAEGLKGLGTSVSDVLVPKRFHHP